MRWNGVKTASPDEIEAVECVRDTTDIWSFEVTAEPIKLPIITPDGDGTEDCEPYTQITPPPVEKSYDFPYVPYTGMDPGIKYDDATITEPVLDSKDVYFTRIRITHELAASGVSACVYQDDGGGEPDLETILCEPGWERAKVWVDERTQGRDVDLTSADTIFLAGFPCNGGIPAALQNYQSGNYLISKSLNKEAGTYSTTETWDVLIFDSDFLPPDEMDPMILNDVFRAGEDYTVEVTESCDGSPTQVTINGTITGMGEVDWCPFQVIQSKIESAKSYWSRVSNILYCRADECYNGHCKLHPKPITLVTGINEQAGTLSYSVEYNDRPISFIPGACVERISFSDVLPAQSIATQAVIGRKRGPVLQDLQTTNARSKALSMDITMERLSADDGCILNCAGLGLTTREATLLTSSPPKDAADQFVCCQQCELEEIYDSVFRVEDNETWDPIGRRYTRNVRWSFEDCQSPTIDNFKCE